MWISIKYVSIIVSSLIGLWLLATYTKGELRSGPLYFQKLNLWGRKYKSWLALVAGCLIIVHFSVSWHLDSQKSIESFVLQGVGETRLEKATLFGFDRELKEVAKERVHEARKHFRLGEMQMTSNNFISAIRHFKDSIKYIPTMSAYLNLGVCLFNTSRIEEAEHLGIQGLQIANSKDNARFQASFYNFLGLVFRNLSQFKKSLKAFRDAQRKYEEIGDNIGIAGSELNLATVYSKLERYEKALDSLEESEEIFKNEEDLKSLALVYQNMGNVYISQGKIKKAQDKLNKQLLICRRLNLEPCVGDAYGNLGRVYMHLSRYEEALAMFSNAQVIHERLRDRLGEANDISYRGSVFRLQKNYEKSLDHHLKALNIYRDLNNPYEEAIELRNLGLVYKDMGRDQEAFDYLIEARRMLVGKGIDHKGNIVSNIDKNIHILVEQGTVKDNR